MQTCQFQTVNAVKATLFEALKIPPDLLPIRKTVTSGYKFGQKKTEPIQIEHQVYNNLEKRPIIMQTKKNGSLRLDTSAYLALKETRADGKKPKSAKNSTPNVHKSKVSSS